jgi:hypothetical protein
MKPHSAILLTICVLSTACSRDSQPALPNASLPRSVSVSNTYDESVPPTRKEIVRALLASQDVSLAVDSSCSGVGTEPADANIGDYISGFLAEQNSDKGKNWLDIVTKRASVPGAEPAWTCDVVIRHVDGEDRWGWGVSFQMKAKDHSIVKTSFRCTGSG